MAYLLSQDDSDVIHATTHGMINREDLGFLRERMSATMRTVGSFASKYLTEARDKLEAFDLGRLRDRVEVMRDRFGKRWDEDRILEVVDLSGFQNAKPTMRKYIMAEPRTRRLYHQGRLDGYGSLYVDDAPDCVGREHTAYREVMQGAFVGDEEEDRFVTYMGLETEEGQPLSHVEREAIRRTWAEQRALLDRGTQDPTSPLRKTL